MTDRNKTIETQATSSTTPLLSALLSLNPILSLAILLGLPLLLSCVFGIEE